MSFSQFPGPSEHNRRSFIPSQQAGRFGLPWNAPGGATTGQLAAGCLSEKVETSLSTAETTADAAPTVQRAKSPSVILGIILVCQLMIGLDATIVNVAVPKIQTALHFSTVSASWVLNIYALALGGLVLFGGRTGDILGRRRVFMLGITLFTLASLAGGLSTAGWELIVARGAQGVGMACDSAPASATERSSPLAC
jgi:hypothetical protein